MLHVSYFVVKFITAYLRNSLVSTHRLPKRMKSLVQEVVNVAGSGPGCVEILSPWFIARKNVECIL